MALNAPVALPGPCGGASWPLPPVEPAEGNGRNGHHVGVLALEAAAGGGKNPADLSFAPGTADLGSFPRVEWERAVRRSLARLPDAALGSGDSRGLPQLRAALADYLGRVRGAIIEPDHLVVVNGFAQGLVVIARLFRRHGITTQFPTGAVLSAERRRRLLAWAEQVDGYIVEDNYDAEYRYDHQPVATVQGLAPTRVLLGGSTSKTLAVISHAARNGLQLSGSAGYRRAPGPAGFVLAYAHLNHDQLRRGVRILAAAMPAGSG